MSGDTVSLLVYSREDAFSLINPSSLHAWQYSFMMAGTADLDCGGEIIRNCEVKGSQSVSLASLNFLIYFKGEFEAEYCTQAMNVPKPTIEMGFETTNYFWPPFAPIYAHVASEVRSFNRCFI